MDERGVSFRWKDYRAKGRTRYKMMTLSAGEFMRHFLLHVLLCGFRRIRHYGLIANADRKKNLAKARELRYVVHNDNAACHKVDAPTSIASFTQRSSVQAVMQQ